MAVVLPHIVCNDQVAVVREVVHVSCQEVVNTSLPADDLITGLWASQNIVSASAAEI
ncbi:MAG TPA: hypothetical protein VJ869_11710 [Sphaerochaeta sp.]|nr:hypothetical protein [Sphaerochaeta sp.]